MIETPEISFCLPSNRPFMWKNLYNTMHLTAKGLSFEIVVAGPYCADYSLPSNFRHIKTGNVKVPQCCEIAIRNAQGKNFVFIGDDSIFEENVGLLDLYKEYQKVLEQKGGNTIILPRLIVRRSEQQLKYNKLSNGPIASLNCALLNRDLLKIIGGIDINFVGVYWDCDMAMRFQEAGVHIFKSDTVIVREGAASNGIYLHRICKPHDKDVLNSFWARCVVEGEPVPSDSVWCYMKHPQWVVSKKRLKKFVGYEDDNILTISQGPRSYGGLSWD